MLILKQSSQLKRKDTVICRNLYSLLHVVANQLLHMLGNNFSMTMTWATMVADQSCCRAGHHRGPREHRTSTSEAGSGLAQSNGWWSWYRRVRPKKRWASSKLKKIQRSLLYKTFLETGSPVSKNLQTCLDKWTHGSSTAFCRHGTARWNVQFSGSGLSGHW